MVHREVSIADGFGSRCHPPLPVRSAAVSDCEWNALKAQEIHVRENHKEREREKGDETMPIFQHFTTQRGDSSN